LAGQNPSAITATPEGTCSTAFTPGMFSISKVSNLTGLPPNTGERATSAVNIPGKCTSIPNSAVPLIFEGVSNRSVGLPTCVNSLAVFNVTSAGAVNFDAASANDP